MRFSVRDFGSGRGRGLPCGFLRENDNEYERHHNGRCLTLKQKTGISHLGQVCVHHLKQDVD